MTPYELAKHNSDHTPKHTHQISAENIGLLFDHQPGILSAYYDSSSPCTPDLEVSRWSNWNSSLSDEQILPDCFPPSHLSAALLPHPSGLESKL